MTLSHFVATGRLLIARCREVDVWFLTLLGGTHETLTPGMHRDNPQSHVYLFCTGGTHGYSGCIGAVVATAASPVETSINTTVTTLIVKTILKIDLLIGLTSVG